MTATLRVGLVQMQPIWLQRAATIDKICAQLEQASGLGCHLTAFGEALLPGYPFWVENTEGARFESQLQKELYAHYLDQSVQIEAGHLEPICEAAERHNVGVYLGLMERPLERGGNSLYASLAYIDPDGEIRSVHRKLMPTYEERLVWAVGDGHGLQVHPLREFHVGGLNCWENWMPLSRASLYAQGENVHVAVWPGNHYNTREITRFIAKESRSYVVSVSGLMTRDAINDDLPHAQLLRESMPEQSADGGSCVAAPDGSWLLEPQSGEGIFTADLELDYIRRERHSFDPVGHYSRPDVIQLKVNRERQQVLDEK